METTIQFIEVVKRHEAIYDTTHPDYKNMERKANAWRDVAQEVGLTVEACKRKWKNLRDSYTKYLRSFRTGTKTSRKYQYWAHATHMEFLRPFQGPGRSQVFKVEDPYDKFEHMEFLRPFQTTTGRFKLEDIYDDAYKQDSVCDFGFEVLEKCSPDVNNIDILDAATIDNHHHHHHHHQKLDTTAAALNINGLNKNKPNFPMLRIKDLDATSMFFLSLAKSVRNMPKKYQASVKMQCMKIVSDAEIAIDNAVVEIDDSNMSGSNGTLSPNVNNNNNNNINSNNNNNDNYNNNSSSNGNRISESHSSTELSQRLSQSQELIVIPDQVRQQQGLGGGGGGVPDNSSTNDNSEHFLYVMSPSKVEAMIDISSDDEN